ncbi:unnamed protein product [Camellia sinensis]
MPRKRTPISQVSNVLSIGNDAVSGIDGKERRSLLTKSQTDFKAFGFCSLLINHLLCVDLKQSLRQRTEKRTLISWRKFKRHVGTIQFPFVSDCGAFGDLHLHISQDAIPHHPGTENRLPRFLLEGG